MSFRVLPSEFVSQVHVLGSGPETRPVTESWINHGPQPLFLRPVADRRAQLTLFAIVTVSLFIPSSLIALWLCCAVYAMDPQVSSHSRVPQATVYPCTHRYPMLAHPHTICVRRPEPAPTYSYVVVNSDAFGCSWCCWCAWLHAYPLSTLASSSPGALNCFVITKNA